MLINVSFRDADGPISAILAAISGSNRKEGGSVRPSSIGKGMYLGHHWSFEQVCADALNAYPDFANDRPPNAYGVCDSPEQFMELYGDALNADKRCFVVSFVEIVRADQEPEGGWRWHKWGPYVGTQKSEHEYLYDDANIERVFTFHVYEVKIACCACGNVPSHAEHFYSRIRFWCSKCVPWSGHYEDCPESCRKILADHGIIPPPEPAFEPCSCEEATAYKTVLGAFRL